MSETPITLVPPEIWEQIGDNIHSSKDLVNLTKVIPNFKNAVYPKRVEWLCYQVLPVLVTNTYSSSYNRFQKDFSNCRLVCKHWKFAVDNFLENNVLHYPASGDDLDWKLNRCHNGQLFYLHRTETIFRPIRPHKMEKILHEFVNHPGNPIVGGYVHLGVPEQENMEGVHLVERFVQTFGCHINYLKIHCSEKTDVVIFIFILLRLLPNLPNLKGLSVMKFFNDTKKYNLDDLKLEINRTTGKTISHEYFGNALSKLETLNLEIDGLSNYLLKEIIINTTCLKNLKSLTIKNFVDYLSLLVDLPNLLHLSLQFNDNDKLESVLALKCPNLRKLDLSKVMYKDLDYDLLCQVIQQFKGNLNHLALHLPDFLETGDGEDKRMKMIRFFSTRGLLPMPKIKSLSLHGSCPPSLNFVCGENFRSLEYLNLYLEHEVEDAINYPLPEANSEVTDIIQRLAQVWIRGCWKKKPDLYKSNLWTVFPKLKSILVDSHWEPLNLNGWVYRRNEL